MSVATRWKRLLCLLMHVSVTCRRNDSEVAVVRNILVIDQLNAQILVL